MKYLLILDLCGTLIEAIHVCEYGTDYEKDLAREYQSRINYIGRKLNSFLTDSDNKIVIITSVDHCVKDSLKEILEDIDLTIMDANKDRIEYYISKGFYPASAGEPKFNIIESKSNIKEVITKEEAYDSVLRDNFDYYPITVDDRPEIENFLKVLNRGGQCVFLNNDLHTLSITHKYMDKVKRKSHLYDTFDQLVNYYDRFEYDIDINDIYKKLYSNELDMDCLYNLKKLKGIIDSSDYNKDQIKYLMDHHCIQIHPSFESAYQKVILPKIR